jgi:hypothetical protein
VDASKEPAFLPLLEALEAFQRLGTRLLETDRSSVAEIAVLLDDESFFYGSNRNYLDVPLIFQQRLRGLTRTGALPFGSTPPATSRTIQRSNTWRT